MARKTTEAQLQRARESFEKERYHLIGKYSKARQARGSRASARTTAARKAFKTKGEV